MNLFKEDCRSSVKFIVPLLLLSSFIFIVVSYSKNHWSYGDEVESVACGYAHLMFDFRVGRSNPPLIKQLLALPLKFMQLDFPVNAKAWKIGHDASIQFSQDFIYNNQVNHEKIIFSARMMALTLSCIAGIAIYIWSYSLWGGIAAFFSLALYILTPAVVTASGTAQTDIGITLFFFLSIFSFWLLLRNPNVRNFLFFSISNGLSHSAKVSSIILLPIELFILKIHEKKDFKKKVFILLFSWFIALSVLVLDYGIFGFLKYFETLRWVLGDVIGRRQWYYGFMGVVKPPPSFYILFCALLRTPIPILIFFLCGIVFSFKTKESYFLIIPAAIYFVFAANSKLQMGDRLLLPMVPFLCVTAGNFLAYCFRRELVVKFTAFILMGWLVVGNLRILPHSHAYFNEIAGGTDGGWKYFSSLDTSQDGKQLAQFIKNNSNASLIVSMQSAYELVKAGSLRVQPYFCADLTDSVYVNPVDVEKEFLAVGVGHLYDLEACVWFKNMKPMQKIGYSIYVYDITDNYLVHFYLANHYQQFSKQNPSFIAYAQREFARAKAIKEKQIKKQIFG